MIMSEAFADDFGDTIEVEDDRPHRGRLADPDDPNSEYLLAPDTDKRSGIPSRPLVAHRCEKVRKNGKRCKCWSIHGHRYCVTHSGYKYLPNVKEYHDQTVHNAKAALMRMVPAALDRIDQIITDDDADIPASVRLKASTEVLDRVGVRGGAELDVRVEDGVDPAQTLLTRLETLRTRAVQTAASLGQPDPRVIEGVVVPSGDQDQLPLFEDTP